MFYIIRTLRQSGTKILIQRSDLEPDEGGQPPRQYGHPTLESAQRQAARVPGEVGIHEFASDAEARMYLDPACINFRLRRDSQRQAGAAGADGAMDEEDASADPVNGGPSRPSARGA